jgi:hypothetical protein
MVIDPGVNLVWDQGEHEIGNPDGNALMGDTPTADNSRVSTVVIKNTTKVGIDLAGNGTLNNDE